MQIKILTNAHIYTGSADKPWATNLAIVNGKVAALNQAALSWSDAPGVVVEDQNGATILPGLTDAHIHLSWYALGLQALDLRGCTRDALIQSVAQHAASLPPGQWIKGRGWDQNLWGTAATESTFPTAAELDTVAPHHPVALTAKSGHALVANSEAMRRAGLLDTETQNQPEVAYGHIARDAKGRPTGMFFENAMRLISDAIPQPTLEEIASAQALAQEHLLKVGITAIHDVDGGLSFAAYQTLRHSQKLVVRVVKYSPLETFEEVLKVGLRSGYGDDVLRYGGLKLFTDGALGARTAAMLAPYEDEPDNIGIPTLDYETLHDIAQRATDGGIALAVHAIGDRANRMVLDALESTIPPEQTAKPQHILRHRIEHVQLITPEDQQRLGKLGIVASMQPIHAIHDMDMADRYWGARAKNAYAWRSLQDADAILAFGSDAPVESFDPFVGLYAAVTRCTEEGHPSPAGWYPEQRLTLSKALRAYTWGAAYAGGMEDKLGCLLPGYYADLIVLNQNIFQLPSPALLETQVLRTMVGGIWRYHAAT